MTHVVTAHTKFCCVAIKVAQERSSIEGMILEQSLLRSKHSTGAKVPWSESFWSLGMKVPLNRSSTPPRRAGLRNLAALCMQQKLETGWSVGTENDTPKASRGWEGVLSLHPTSGLGEHLELSPGSRAELWWKQDLVHSRPLAIRKSLSDWGQRFWWHWTVTLQHKASK